MTIDVLVIGGGLHGLSSALTLARAGRRVTLLERAWTGRHASGASAAGVRTLQRDMPEVPISLESMDMWHRIEEIVGDDCGFHSHGQVCVAENDGEIADLERRAGEMRAAGYEHEEMVDRAELRRLVPAIASHCVGALVARHDGAADPHRTLVAFRRAFLAAGGTIREGTGVIGIDRQGGDWAVRAGAETFVAPVIVNAAGAWGGRVAAMLGDDIALDFKPAMMMVTKRIAPLVEPVVLAAERPLSFKQSAQGTLVIGGGLPGRADLDTERSEVDFLALSRGARAARDLFPGLGAVGIVRSWAGIEARTADLLPVLGASPTAPGVVHSFGYSGHGFQLVPVAGAIVADLVLRGGTNRSISAFAPERLMRSGGPRLDVPAYST